MSDTGMDCEITPDEAILLNALDGELHGLLRQVSSSDIDSAADALFHLKSKVCPQGVAISRSTSAALPILIRISALGKSAVRREVLQVVARIHRASHAWRKSAQNARPEYAGNYDEKIQWEIAVDRALSDAMPVLRRFEGDSDAVIAAAARDLVMRISSSVSE
ncbi:hypothetical protein [Streptomyces amritsarensis]|uniref:hypothetical protein n=1 Tax=Streptomyces amritsarensis TaxID=681158 RepID=UPI00117FF348|nr:hypothetical protein [Streptomyces amritsarensis]